MTTQIDSYLQVDTSIITSNAKKLHCINGVRLYYDTHAPSKGRFDFSPI